CVVRKKTRRPAKHAKDILAVCPLEFLHEGNQRLHAFPRKSVIDRRSNATNRTMSLQSVQSSFSGFAYKLLFKILAGQPERDVHQRSTVRMRVTTIEAARV